MNEIIKDGEILIYRNLVMDETDPSLTNPADFYPMTLILSARSHKITVVLDECYSPVCFTMRSFQRKKATIARNKLNHMLSHSVQPVPFEAVVKFLKAIDEKYPNIPEPVRDGGTFGVGPPCTWRTTKC